MPRLGADYFQSKTYGKFKNKMTSRLPHGLQILAEAAGIDAALTIAMERGGTRLTIPQKADGTIIEKFVGIDAARKIVDELAGERIEIPLAKRIMSDWLREQGWSQEKRAAKLKASRRTIQNWDGGGAPTMQTDLFDISA